MKRMCFVLCCFLALAGCDNKLSKETLGEWASASDADKTAVISRHFRKNAGYVRRCMDRMSMLPSAQKIKVLDAGKICLAGLRLKDEKPGSK